jgi:hypothetical protein
MSNFLININLFKNGGPIFIGVICRTWKIYSGSALRLMGSRCILARSSTTGWNVDIHMCLCLFGVTVDGFSTIYSHSKLNLKQGTNHQDCLDVLIWISKYSWRADLLCTNPSGSTHPRWMRFAILWRSDLVNQVSGVCPRSNSLPLEHGHVTMGFSGLCLITRVIPKTKPMVAWKSPVLDDFGVIVLLIRNHHAVFPGSGPIEGPTKVQLTCVRRWVMTIWRDK